MKTIKKLLALTLVLCMVFCLSVAVFADEPSTTPTYTDVSSITFKKNYEATNTGTTSPAETFTFSTLTCTSVTDAADGVTAAIAPTPTIAEGATYVAGDAGSANKTKTITINLPEYTSVGIYTYTFKENAGNTAGVTYYGTDITLKVTVVEQDGKVRVAAVHTEEGATGTAAAGTKKSEFDNTYSAGSLAVTKKVTGTMGDKSREFDVTVEFTAPTDKEVKEAITYTEDGQPKTIATTAWSNGKATANIKLKDSETITFTNIPYGVTYTVTEADYTGANGGYDEAVVDYNDATKKIDTASDTVEITNNKGGIPDMGVTLDSLPYILALAVVFGGAVVMFTRKRHIED